MLQPLHYKKKQCLIKQCPNQHENEVVYVGYFYWLGHFDSNNNQHNYVDLIL